MKLTVYYDGLCQLCSREISHYYGLQGVKDQVEFVDYTNPRFDAHAEGLDSAALDKYMHVKRPDGQIRVGVDAFAELWMRVPRFRWLAKLAGNRLLNPLFRLGYFAFARVRPWLPKRRQSCPLTSA